MFFCLFFIWAYVSPCWQRGITAPGIESSSQAFGWRSTSQMKRILVLLKVAAVPVDAFAVTLGVIYNPFFTRFLFIHVVFSPPPVPEVCHHDFSLASHPTLTCSLTPFCSIWLWCTNLIDIRCFRCSYGFELSGSISLFFKPWISKVHFIVFMASCMRPLSPLRCEFCFLALLLSNWLS